MKVLSTRRPGVSGFILPVIFLASMILSQSCAPDGSSGEAKAADLEQVAAIPVETLVLRPQTFVDRFEVMGTAEPRETVRVHAEIPGRVLAANFDEGDRVRRGQNLYRIDVEVDSARIDVLKSQVSSAERELGRMANLAREGLATPQQIDQAETALENAELNLRQARVGAAKNQITSPISGHITRKFVDLGEYASPGTPLAEVVIYDTIVIRALLPESEVRYVRPGTILPVELPALGRTVDGEVKRVDIVAKSPSLTYPVEIHISNEDLSILPGMRAAIVITRAVLDEVILVPREAVLEGFNAQEAVVIDEESGRPRASLRPIKLGPGHESTVVVEEGLVSGDRVIVRGHRGLVAGTRVEIIQQNQQSSLSKRIEGETL
ncbi:MAG: efflux RND transporter periplasmic adaptor subunit [Bradymonadaceae bacterium]